MPSDKDNRPGASAPRGRATARHRAPPRLRTYVLIALGEATLGGAALDDAASVREFARPLGTLAASTRTLARAAACALYTDVPPANLRAVAAGSAPPGYLARALALDGQRMLGEMEGAA